MTSYLAETGAMATRRMTESATGALFGKSYWEHVGALAVGAILPMAFGQNTAGRTLLSMTAIGTGVILGVKTRSKASKRGQAIPMGNLWSDFLVIGGAISLVTGAIAANAAPVETPPLF